MEYDLEKLRTDLINYFGSATTVISNALIDLIEVENATDNELINIAIKNNINLNNYILNVKIKRIFN